MTKNITMEIQNSKNHQVDHLPRLILYILHIFFLEKTLYKKFLQQKPTYASLWNLTDHIKSNKVFAMRFTIWKENLTKFRGKTCD